MLIYTPYLDQLTFKCVLLKACSHSDSVPFVLHGNFTGSGSKVDRFDPHMVGGLKWIQLDSMSAVGGVGSKSVYSVMLHKLYIAKFAMAATCVDWSNDETKALGGWGLLTQTPA